LLSRQFQTSCISKIIKDIVQAAQDKIMQVVVGCISKIIKDIAQDKPVVLFFFETGVTCCALGLGC
jgi:uncharacterized lipoprotein YajG